jgi:hypothetical protein
MNLGKISANIPLGDAITGNLARDQLNIHDPQGKPFNKKLAKPSAT